jgi:hypothetical protein
MDRLPSLIVLWCLLLFGVACAGAKGSSSGATSPAGYPEQEASADEEMGGAAHDDGARVGADTVAVRNHAEGAGMPPGNFMGVPPAAPPPPEPDAEPAPDGNTEPEAQAQKPGSPLLIYQATLTMAVFEAKKRIDEVEAIAKAEGGYLLTRSGNSITIRVPAARFSEALEKVAKTGDELDREVSARDVTEQFNDLTIRLKNAEAMRERLVGLLARAQNVKEALAVEEQLERVARDIELIKGKLKLLGELVSFSTITARFQPRPVDKVDSTIDLPFPWLHQLGLTRLLNL